MSVRFQKLDFIVDTVGHYNLGPNVVFETLEVYTSFVRLVVRPALTVFL